MDYVTLFFRICELLHVSVEFSRVRKVGVTDNVHFLHEAFIPEENQKSLGLGKTVKSSKQDNSKKILYLIFSNFSDRILAIFEINETMPTSISV